MTPPQTHYQGRLEKMHFLQAELRLVDERHGGGKTSGIALILAHGLSLAFDLNLALGLIRTFLIKWTLNLN